tara:strand:+ start:1614 stop:1997 length:384 start_codon:yes stop_codon:yes gene_type:complete
MPQIKKPFQDAFYRYLTERGYRATPKQKRVGDLKATQKNLVPRYVEGIAADGVHSIIQGKPMLSSSDGYILDGHHRWAALLMLDPDQRVRIIEVNAPIKKLLQLVKGFPHTQYSSVVASFRRDLSAS